jgi:hypothetical protein
MRLEKKQKNPNAVAQRCPKERISVFGRAATSLSND